MKKELPWGDNTIGLFKSLYRRIMNKRCKRLILLVYLLNQHYLRYMMILRVTYTINCSPNTYKHILQYFFHFIDDINTTQFSNCSNTSFLDHGYWKTSVTVYNMYSVINESECQASCRDDFTCWGFTYREDNMICSLSHDKMSLDASPCDFCRFYEKTCQPCMYQTS